MPGSPRSPASRRPRPRPRLQSCRRRVPALDKTAPRIKTLKLSRKGTRLQIVVTLSEAGKITAAVQKAKPGRRSRGHCVAPTRKLRRAKRCTRYVTVARVSRAAARGHDDAAPQHQAPHARQLPRHRQGPGRGRQRVARAHGVATDPVTSRRPSGCRRHRQRGRDGRPHRRDEPREPGQDRALHHAQDRAACRQAHHGQAPARERRRHARPPRARAPRCPEARITVGRGRAGNQSATRLAPGLASEGRARRGRQRRACASAGAANVTYSPWGCPRRPANGNAPRHGIPPNPRRRAALKAGRGDAQGEGIREGPLGRVSPGGSCWRLATDGGPFWQDDAVVERSRDDDAVVPLIDRQWLSSLPAGAGVATRSCPVVQQLQCRLHAAGEQPI